MEEGKCRFPCCGNSTVCDGRKGVGGSGRVRLGLAVHQIEERSADQERDGPEEKDES